MHRSSRYLPLAIFRRTFVVGLFTSLLSLTGCAYRDMTSAEASETTSASSQALQNLIDEHWQAHLKRDPVFASRIGVRDYDSRLASLSVTAMDAEAAEAAALLARLESIDKTSLSQEEKLNAKLLALNLRNTVAANSFDGRLMIITNRYGWHSNFARLPERLRLTRKQDYLNYIERLKDFSRHNQEGIATLRAAIAAGYVHPCAPMAGYEVSMQTHIVDAAEKSVFMAPFKKLPDSFTPSEQQSLRANAAMVISQQVIPAYQELLNFYLSEYKPKCRKASGIYGLPNADAYYAHLIRDFTTTNLSADEIHRLGLSEVERIINEMNDVIAKTDFTGERKAFVEFLRTDPKFYAKDGDELLRYTSYISKKADGGLPLLFNKIPRMPYTVLPIPDDIAEKTTTAYYEPPSGEGTRPGVYRVNLSKLDTRPLFEVEALTLHEAVPGHHFQIALAEELESLPAFRRYDGVTAFVEGWGLYAERLGLEMGFYQNPYSNYGRLSYEMWRACRLVVDTGLHAKGWTRQQAIDFMLANTALSQHNIEAEVDRYITWPGQALAYKLGELKIRELRSKAERSLGASFDVRSFHDAVLENGAVPLTVLEQLIDEWIASQN